MNIRGLLVLAVLLSASSGLAAGSSNLMNVLSVRIDSSGNGLFILSGNSTGRPTCGNPIPNGYAFSVNNEAGKAIMQAALSAKLAGRTVTVGGANVCTVFGSNVEDALSLTVN